MFVKNVTHLSLFVHNFFLQRGKVFFCLVACCRLVGGVPMVVLKVGDAAPQFRLKDGDGKYRGLADNGGLVLYFYPKDFTPDCTTQLKEFTEEYFYFRRLGFDVFGVSPDNQESHKRFCEMHKAPYPLLSDLDGSVAKAYGVWREDENGAIVRSTFVIRNGVVLQAHYRVKDVFGHASSLLQSLEKRRSV